MNNRIYVVFDVSLKNAIKTGKSPEYKNPVLVSIKRKLNLLFESQLYCETIILKKIMYNKPAFSSRIYT